MCLSVCLCIRFGPPLILRVWRDLNHSQFQSVVLKALMKYLREGVRLVDVSVGGGEGRKGEGRESVYSRQLFKKLLFPLRTT